MTDRRTFIKQLSAAGIMGSMPGLLQAESGYGKMKNTSLVLFFTILFFLAGCTERQSGTFEAAPFKKGIGIVEITPPEGYYHYRGTSTGVKDPLFAKAIVFTQGETKAALLICDILSIPRDLSRTVREKASEQTGIPFENISITATHTHTGPSIREPLRSYFEIRASGDSGQNDPDDYIETLIDRMTEAIVAAHGNTRETEFYAGISEVDGISFNRRFLMTDGRVRFNPGIGNPRIVNPVGPNDPDFHYVLFRPEDQADFSTSLSVFANHLDTYGGTEYSADYPYYLQKYLRKHFGEDFISIFGTGTCGDINHVDVNSPPEATRRQFITDKIGKELAEAIKTDHPRLSKGIPNLNVSSSTIFLPLQDITEEDLEWARDRRTSPRYSERPFLTERRRRKIIDIEHRRQSKAIPPSAPGEPWRLPVEIHAYRLDDQTAIVTMPGEVFAELGLELKSRSPFANTMIIELANLDIAYIPTKRAFSEGGYEAINSRLAPGSGENMIEEALKMLNQLTNN